MNQISFVVWGVILQLLLPFWIKEWLPFPVWKRDNRMWLFFLANTCGSPNKEPKTYSGCSKFKRDTEAIWNSSINLQQFCSRGVAGNIRVPDRKKIIELLYRHPPWGRILFLPATHWSLPLTLEGLFSWNSATQGPSPSTYLVNCFWNNRESRTLSGVLR